ncbi:MAG: hypothetical protein U0Y82_05780 [Thermoleophilia bacterium]
MYAPGRELPLEVLGRGRVVARVNDRREISYHGIPGMAWRVTLTLPDGARVEGLQVGSQALRFLDPRWRLA